MEKITKEYEKMLACGEKWRASIRCEERDGDVADRVANERFEQHESACRKALSSGIPCGNSGCHRLVG